MRHAFILKSVKYFAQISRLQILVLFLVFSLSFQTSVLLLTTLFTNATSGVPAQRVAHTNKVVIRQEPLAFVPSLAPLRFASQEAVLSASSAGENTPKKKTYTIAVYGDSMQDTMGEYLQYLDKSLKVKYSGTDFRFYNYGIGGQNVGEGLARLDSAFQYGSRNYPPLAQIHPDVVIIGSFAYNPFSPYDRDKHWLLLSQLVQKVKSIASSTYLLAEIAPLKNGFGKGPNGVNWPEEMANTQVEHINQQLKDTISLSTALHVGLINAYISNPAYVDPNDGIHPSMAGHSFISQRIANTIKLQ